MILKRILWAVINHVLAVALLLAFNVHAKAGQLDLDTNDPNQVAAPYPKVPDSQLTPGDICTTPNKYRYPEQIAYCDRHVEAEAKQEIIKEYDQNRGYRIQTMPRGQFKIDHFIPLCMGGSNQKENLWPQHATVYKLTDPLEQEACAKMAEGKLLQQKAIELIRQAKLNLSEVNKIRDMIHAL